MIDRIFIPTLNRVENQITLNNLPDNLKKITTLVVQKWERHKYKYDVDYLILPENLTTEDYLCLAKTRKIIYEEGKNIKYAIIDDDINFRRRNAKRFGLPSDMEKSQRICNEKDINEMFNIFDKWLDEKNISFCGCSHLENIPAEVLYRDNTSIGSAVWFNGSDFANILQELPMTEVKYSEDTLFFLSLLSKGYGNRISQMFCFENISVKGKIQSDVWDKSEFKEVWNDHKKIENKFPDFYKILLDEKGNRIKGGFRNYGKVRVSWNKCYKSSQKNKLEKTKTYEKYLRPSNKFPIYIPSKSRADSRLTVKALESMGVSYHIIVEKEQYEDYAQVIDRKNILILDKKYQDEYDTCDDLGNTKSKGPGAARNFAWDHSIKNGHKWHWVMDDNIKAFKRYNKNQRIRCNDATPFIVMEDFVLRYKNIAMAGPNYTMFVTNKSANHYPPFSVNCRIYSCNLIRNDVPFRWRGRYNEDTDLSLRMLKSNWCTIQFYAFLQEKINTQIIKGGNTEAFYDKEGTLPKSQMLVQLHPDVTKIKWRFGRWHHIVDYTRFKISNRLIKKDIHIKEGINNYGMKLKKYN